MALFGPWPGIAVGMVGNQARSLSLPTDTHRAGAPRTEVPGAGRQDSALGVHSPTPTEAPRADPQHSALRVNTPTATEAPRADPQHSALRVQSPTRTGAPPLSALVVFLSPAPASTSHSEDDAIERELASIPGLSTGILSATQGAYKADQLLLDMTQGARVSYSAYTPAYPPYLASLAFEAAPGARVQEWPAVLRRAAKVPQLLEPGLLAASIPGGAAYAAPFDVDGANSIATTIDVSERKTRPVTIDWPLAANRSGRIAAVSFGTRSTLLARIDRLRATHSLVVADLPAGAAGYADLRMLVASRAPGELLGVVQSAREAQGEELLWTAFAGAGTGGGHTLTSQTTNQRGMIAAIDIAPTILNHLRLPIPAVMRGRVIHTDGHFDSAALRSLKSRLGVLASRRLPAMAWLLAAWALLLAITRLPLAQGERRPQTSPTATADKPHAQTSPTADRPPAQASPTPTTDGPPSPTSAATGAQAQASPTPTADARRARGAWALRVGGLALMWTPVVALVPAAIEPTRTAEFALIVALCFAFGALTDRLVPWPRAPIAPALAAVVALSVDALAGTQLLMRSLLGPNPEFGARFYGIGNELKSALAVLVFAAVAATLYPAVRSRQAAATMAGAGILLAIVEGSARIGAGVGGVILVSAGTAVATSMLLPGAVNRTRILLVMAAPVVGLVALAALDLATAHGGGHFTGSVLDARSADDIRDIIVRRYGAAWDELKNHLMPLATALALFASVLAVRRRDRVCAPIDSDPGWVAALSGGLTAGVVGALTEDSGPVLFVVAVFVLACVLSYLWGGPIVSRPAREAVDRAIRGRPEHSGRLEYGISNRSAHK
jgi:hypothetical protein